MRFQPLHWFQSVHAKLFILTGLVTTALTVIVAYSITANYRVTIENYTQNLAIQTAKTVETEIQQRDPEFKDPRKIKEVLESLQGSDKSIVRIDVFRAESRDRVAFVTSSDDDDQVIGTWGPLDGWRLGGKNNNEDTPFADRMTLGPAEDPKGKSEKDSAALHSTGWRIFLPISNPKAGKQPIGLVRVYSDMEQWEVVWNANLKRTYKILPPVLVAEFLLLWVILSWLLNDPLKDITGAMARLERGNLEARANSKRNDELGRIADRFNKMAAQLQRAALEREALIEEIRGLNLGLQARIDEALSALQAKNHELELLMERIALLREELGQQERLAVAGQLTAAFAHEVGTPLNLVNGHLQLLTSQSDLSDKTRERLGVIQAQIQRVGDIVRKLLGHTRRPELHRTPIKLNALIMDLQRLWNPTLAAHGITFDVDAPEDCFLLVDRKQMEQLFINLVNNAADAMSQGGRIRLHLAEEKGLMEASSRWEVTLTDDGAGIPSEVLPMVFKPMFTTKPEGKGTGLGLPICREIVRAHGGEIRIESQPGEGTSICFTLPKAEHLVGTAAVG
jgi:signal transduction histidine kinase